MRICGVVSRDPPRLVFGEWLGRLARCLLGLAGGLFFWAADLAARGRLARQWVKTPLWRLAVNFHTIAEAAAVLALVPSKSSCAVALVTSYTIFLVHCSTYS